MGRGLEFRLGSASHTVTVYNRATIKGLMLLNCYCLSGGGSIQSLGLGVGCRVSTHKLAQGKNGIRGLHDRYWHNMAARMVLYRQLSLTKQIAKGTGPNDT